MATTKKLSTIVSAEGQVTLPSSIRTRRNWSAGTQLLVEETSEGVLLRPAHAFAVTRPEDVFASLHHRDESNTPEEMDAGILAEAQRRHIRD